MSRLKVVIVEDDPALSTMLVRFLSGSGLEVHHAADGAEGLRLVRETSPDVLLADLMVPELSGQELIAKVREEVPGLPVVAMSASINGHEQATAMNPLLGADLTLSKPLVLKDLLKALQDVAAQPRS